MTSAPERSDSSRQTAARASNDVGRRTSSSGHATAVLMELTGWMSRTIPAPERSAPRLLSAPAPSMPGPPATTVTAALHLCEVRDRSGQRSRSSDVSKA